MGMTKTALSTALSGMIGCVASYSASAAPSCFAGTPTAGNSTVNLTVSGQNRSYRLHIPAGLPSGQPVPVVLVLHTLGGTASGTQSGTGWDATADANRFVVAYPQGLSNSWNVSGHSPNVDDVSYLKAVGDSISTRARIAPNRIYIAGYSLGGGMSHHMACTQASYFAAAHPFIFHLTDRINSTCAPSRPIGVQEFAGINDPLVRIQGGTVTVGGVTNTFLSAQASFQRWAQLNGCMGSPTTVLTSGDNTIQQFLSCSGGVRAGLGRLSGGHDFLTGSGINPSANAWAFLTTHSNPGQPADACMGGGGTDVNVWLEAERGTVGSLWTRPNDSTASSGVYATVAVGNNSTASAPSSSSGWITLPLSVSTNGTYNVWFRTKAPDANGDSFWLRMDNGPWSMWNGIPLSSSWTWNRFATTYNLSPGNHTFTIGYREDHAQVDKIYITNTATTPSGAGGAPNN